MSDAFDPYLRWLGIRDPGRPPNHYRLLGLDLFENDADVIAVAADRQMAHMRTFQTSQFAALSQRLLNELAAARICLLKPEKKAVYDALLKKQLGSVAIASRAKPQSAAAVPESAGPGSAGPGSAIPVGAAPDATSPAVVPSVAAADEFPDFASLASATKPSGRAASPTARKSTTPAKKSMPLGLWFGLPVAGILLVVGVIAVQRLSESPEVASTDAQKTATRTAPGSATPLPSTPPKGNSDKNSLSGAGASIRPGKSNHAPPAPSESHLGLSSPATTPADHGNGTNPADAKPATPPKGLPPEPPLHSPGDVIRVENPAQPSSTSPTVVSKPPTEVVQTSTDKTNTEKPTADTGNKTTGHDTGPFSAPKHPVPATNPASDSKPKRAPVPSREQITTAEAKVQKLFNVSAAKKLDERAALAKNLYEQGLDSNNQQIDRYVLLRLAMKDAAALGDAELALKAADKLGEQFAVNVAEEKIGVLATLGKTIRTPGAAQVVLSSSQELSESALSDDDFDAAKSLAQLAAGFAARSGDAGLSRQLRQRSTEIDQFKKEFAKASAARDTLQTKPDDPEANYIWGYYVGPIKGEFDRALPFLSKGSDKGMADVAKEELAQPTDPKAQAKLADGWLDASNNEHEPARAHLHSHAAEWYSQAVGKLTGLEKKRVEDQLARLETATKKSSANGKNFVKYLTEGSWEIIWLPNASATDPLAKAGATYKPMRFSADGTCSNQYHSGTWTHDGPNSVVTHYNDTPTLVQRFALGAKGQLECEAYNRAYNPDYLQSRGTGTKLAP